MGNTVSTETDIAQCNTNLAASKNTATYAEYSTSLCSCCCCCCSCIVIILIILMVKKVGCD